MQCQVSSRPRGRAAVQAYADRMDPAEVQFLAEKELVTIVPNFSENKLSLLSVRLVKKMQLSRDCAVASRDRENLVLSIPLCQPKCLCGWLLI